MFISPTLLMQLGCSYLLSAHLPPDSPTGNSKRQGWAGYSCTWGKTPWGVETSGAVERSSSVHLQRARCMELEGNRYMKTPFLSAGVPLPHKIRGDIRSQDMGGGSLPRQISLLGKIAAHCKGDLSRLLGTQLVLRGALWSVRSQDQFVGVLILS